MDHGIEDFFREHARFSRRVSLLALAVSLAGLSLLGLSRTPAGQTLLRRSLRFGYEGPEQFVRRISLKQIAGPNQTLSDLGRVSPQTRRPGGRRARQGEVGTPVPRGRMTGPGSSDQDLTLRSAARSANVPVVMSEDLIIDRLVRPEYPALLLDRNIEGKVTLQALIDTLGRVVEVQTLSSTGERLFERAASDAVMQCRFRPYRPGGDEATEVYAVFRFAFRIY